MASSNNLDALFADGGSPSATQGAGSTTLRKALTMITAWTKNRSRTTRRTKTGTWSTTAPGTGRCAAQRA